VIGALSPPYRRNLRSRCTKREVDYLLVATDAIRDGLNLDVDHVAFSALSKVLTAGVCVHLAPNELGARSQGVAGRGFKSGTFGVTAMRPPLGQMVLHVRLWTTALRPEKA